ncbi:MAG: VTT domain-containing protein [Segetibacter sp.]|jgi:membrane-associated protein|nr:VTT domain-containing protein [Segetibacter sp.]
MIEILSIHFKDLINPEFYIEHGGLWILLFIVFAETGLLAGFFLPGDSLLFVAGIYSDKLAGEVVASGNEFVDLLILLILISVAGILGNFVGYWFGKKSGPFIYHRKDTFFFRKKYLNQAHEFYEKHGGTAIVFARFLPILRTFAPVIAGVVDMDKKKFTYYNIVGSVAWVFSMLIAGHFLQKIILSQFGFDLKEHLEVIVLGIVLVTTLPVLIKIFSRSKSKNSTTQ